MSEQQSEPISAETGSVSASDVQTEPVMTESPAIAPDQELTAPKADAPKVEPSSKPKVEAPKVEVKARAKPEASPRPSGNVMIMSPGDRKWSGEAKASEPAAPKRRIAAMAAVVALAAVAGAIGGALATSGLGRGSATEAATAPRNIELEAAVARIDADIARAEGQRRAERQARRDPVQQDQRPSRKGREGAGRARRKARKALRRSQQAARRARRRRRRLLPLPHRRKWPPPRLRQPPCPRTSRDRWRRLLLPQRRRPRPRRPPSRRSPGCRRSKAGCCATSVYGGALIESRRGVFEIYAGDSIPGVGRVDAIRKQDGRWVVVTSKGLIVSR